MNILMISHEYPPIGGGGANACMYLAGEYIKKGHRVTVLTVFYEGLQEYEAEDGLRIIRLKSARKHKEHCGFMEMFDFMLKAAKASDGLVREGMSCDDPFDICQIFFAIPAGPVGYYLNKKYDLKYVIRFGGGDIPGFQDRFKFIYKILGPFEKLIWNKASFLVANSEGLKELAEAFYNRKSILVIPNGVDPQVFTPGEATVSDTFRVLFVSRLIERKGLQFIIPEIKELAESVKGGLKLTIVGDGPYRGHLEELTDSCGARPYVEFAGQKDKEDLTPYYANADLFILPSKKEGMPNVVLEAMSAGLPVVMTPCQGSRELIDGNGFVAGGKDFIEKIRLIASDRTLARSLGKRSRELIFERFLWENTAERYLELFKM